MCIKSYNIKTEFNQFPVKQRIKHSPVYQPPVLQDICNLWMETKFYKQTDKPVPEVFRVFNTRI